MTQLVLVLRFGLALVYVAAALGKFVGPGSAHELAESFKLQGRLAVAVRALPLAELALAGGLVLGVTARGAGVASCVLLLVFSAFVVRNLRQGRQGDCHCFGKFHSSKIGWPMLGRNALLLVASALIVVSGKQPGGASLHSIWLGSAFVAVAVCGLTIARIRYARAADRRRLVNGTVQPAGGGDLSQRALLVFVAPGCGPCEALLSSLGQSWNGVTAATLWIVASRPEDFDPELLAGVSSDSVLADEDGSLASRYGIDATPSAVALAAHTRDVEAVAVGAGAVERLVGQVAEPVAVLEHMPSPAVLLESVGQHLPGRMGLSRRQITAGGLGWLFAMLVPTSGMAKDLWARASRARGVRCPSCGTCTLCDMQSATGTKVTCRPCKIKCTAKSVCSKYANELPAYQAIASHLLGNGFRQSNDPVALGLSQRGKLVVLSTVTEFTSSSPQTPKATLVYGLTNTDQYAAAYLRDRKGKAVSVVTTNATGQAVATVVPATASTTKGSKRSPDLSTTDASSRTKAVAADAGCPAKCRVAVATFTALAKLAAELAWASTPEGALLAAATYMLTTPLTLAGQFGLSKGAGTTIAALRAASLLDGVIDGLAAWDSSTYWGMICDELCSWSLYAQCSYGGHYDSLAACAKDCPESLKYQAPCLVYVTEPGARADVYLGRF